jgi:hypothetical protein
VKIIANSGCLNGGTSKAIRPYKKFDCEEEMDLIVGELNTQEVEYVKNI